MAIVPVVKSLFVCERVDSHQGKVSVHGIFNAIRPIAGFPHTRNGFCVYAQLINGHGAATIYVDIREATTDESIHKFGPGAIFFKTRLSTVHLCAEFENCRFPSPGLYIVEFFCDNLWMCDTELLVR
jgi:hypothetical protein